MDQIPLGKLNLIAQTLYDKKGFNILAIDVRGVSTLTDFFMIAEGNVDKHVMALGRAIIESLCEIGEKPIHVEGIKDGDWVVIDFVEVVVHIFKPGLRDLYRLEELWREGKIVDVEFSRKEKISY